MDNRSRIFSTIINPPLIFGVTGGFFFLIMTMLFVSFIGIRSVFGFIPFLVSFFATIYFYYKGVKKSMTDPYWLNMYVIAFFFEIKHPIQFVRRLLTKKDKIFRR